MKPSLSLIFIVLAIHTFSCSAQITTSQPDTLELDSLVETRLTENQIPGLAVGVVKDGEVIVAKGYGFANVEDKIPATRNTIYQLGSVTKMFTGHLLAKLIHMKTISLDDTLAGFFPSSVDFPESPSGQKITIREIATHSAEFPRYPENLDRNDPEPIKGYSKEDLIKGIEMVDIDTAIGARYHYSNFGYGVLGTAIANRTGKDLSTLMEEHIFSVYGMNNSSLYLDSRLHHQLAVPYLEVAPYQRTEPWEMGALSAAGNIFSSVSDLNKFMLTFMMENETKTIQQSAYLKINDTWSYGLGCFVIDSKKRNTRIIYHGGDIDGYASSLTLYHEHRLGIVILTNWGKGQVIGDVFSFINEKVVNHFLGEPVK